jgi:hypothetical protein
MAVSRKTGLLRRKIAMTGRGFSLSSPRHCEPTGGANARPMTGSAKQSSDTLADSLFIRSHRPSGPGKLEETFTASIPPDAMNIVHSVLRYAPDKTPRPTVFKGRSLRGTNRRPKVGRSMPAPPGHFRRQLVLLLPGRHSDHGGAGPAPPLKGCARVRAAERGVVRCHALALRKPPLSGRRALRLICGPLAPVANDPKRS